MKTQIIIKFVIAGLHQWEKCPINEVLYLRQLHRHEFYIKLGKQVFHDDREIEIIQLKGIIMKWLKDKYHSPIYNILNFQNMSCEAIAKILVEKFNLDWCEVLEDNENGAKVTV